MPSEPIPAWAVDLTKQVTILAERLPTHVDWTERNVKDHELRLRATEATLQAMANVIVRLDALDERMRATEKKLWMAYGGLSVVVALIEIVWRALGK